MKVIFLDIDGVLLPINDNTFADNLTHLEICKRRLSADAINALITILQFDNTKIVISSSWRHYMKSAKELLWDISFVSYDSEWSVTWIKNIWDCVIWKTPHATGGWRSTEILLWIDEHHKDCEDWNHISYWVAIDDEWFDMKAIKRMWKLIKTDPEIWLTAFDSQQAILLLWQKC